jgi:hypothetical protein
MALALNRRRDARRVLRKDRCDSVRAVGRSLPAYLVLPALLGWSGCLLFTDPINKAPEVDIVNPGVEIVRGEEVPFWVTGSDDRDSFTSLRIEWAEFDAVLEGCGWITNAEWETAKVTERDSNAPYDFTAKTSATVCLCVRATDHDGARSQDCERIVPVTKKPEAYLADASGALSGQARPLCSIIHLSAEDSWFPEADQIEFNWTMSYTGTDPLGPGIQLVECAGIAVDKAPQHRCFYAAAPGTYTVTMSIKDQPAGSTEATLTSDAVEFTIPVNVDMPPSLQRTEPEIFAQGIVLDTTSGLGAPYPSRTFKVLSVADDCEPYPVPENSGKRPTQFLWSIYDYDATRTTKTWVYQANTTNSLTISRAMFPNAIMGDEIKVRVEVRDSNVVKHLVPGVGACSSDDIDICCGATACTGADSDIIRWTTWTVYFGP